MFGNGRRIPRLLLASIVLACVVLVAVPSALATAPQSQIIRSKIGGNGYPLTNQDGANIQPSW